MVAPRCVDHTQAWAGAVAVLCFAHAILVGGLHVELVEAYAGKNLPLIVQADLVLQIKAAAIDHGMVVTKQRHWAIELLVAAGLAQALQFLVDRFVQHRVALLVAEFQAQQ